MNRFSILSLAALASCPLTGPGHTYLFTVKGNQPGVEKNVQQLYKGLSRAFSPSQHQFDGPKR